jgi:hypothetical protein
VSSSISSRPVALRSTRTDSGSANSDARSTSPRCANPSISSSASGAITSEGKWPIAFIRNHGEMIALTRSW